MNYTRVLLGVALAAVGSALFVVLTGLTIWICGLAENADAQGITIGMLVGCSILALMATITTLVMSLSWAGQLIKSGLPKPDERELRF